MAQHDSVVDRLAVREQSVQHIGRGVGCHRPDPAPLAEMRHEEGRENTLFVHLTLVPWIAAAQELKTKPTQHSVKELRAIGVQPDILLCRSERVIPDELKEKIALFCDVDVNGVITARDVSSVYEIPLTFAEQSVDETVLRLLNLHAGPRNMARWTEMLERMENPVREVTIGPTERNSTAIVSGLEPGEVVVTDGIDKLQPGAQVVVRGPDTGGDKKMSRKTASGEKEPG